MGLCNLTIYIRLKPKKLIWVWKYELKNLKIIKTHKKKKKKNIFFELKVIFFKYVLSMTSLPYMIYPSSR
jgi:hypothetical protein